MSLNEYWKKRNFEKTSEPKGKLKMGEGKIYVIQKHAARHLHYDLRLEMNGVLKSWAIPKEPPISIGIKRLAVEVEDHPIEYANFEGIIPEGEYGAGKVEIWDKGTYKLIEREEDKIVIEINGKKLNGFYALIRMKKSKNWLFFKKK
ncbi:MAG: DNA polymerase ligase N-terminal domain-containing protein [Nitrososphaerota archaeon]